MLMDHYRSAHRFMRTNHSSTSKGHDRRATSCSDCSALGSKYLVRTIQPEHHSLHAETDPVWSEQSNFVSWSNESRGTQTDKRTDAADFGLCRFQENQFRKFEPQTATCCCLRLCQPVLRGSLFGSRPIRWLLPARLCFEIKFSTKRHWWKNKSAYMTITWWNSTGTLLRGTLWNCFVNDSWNALRSPGYRCIALLRIHPMKVWICRQFVVREEKGGNRKAEKCQAFRVFHGLWVFTFRGTGSRGDPVQKLRVSVRSSIKSVSWRFRPQFPIFPC